MDPAQIARDGQRNGTLRNTTTLEKVSFRNLQICWRLPREETRVVASSLLSAAEVYGGTQKDIDERTPTKLPKATTPL